MNEIEETKETKLAIPMDMKNININTLGINLDDIHIYTAMKVGTTNFSHSLFKALDIHHHDPIKHNHTLENLGEFLKINRNKLIITTFRNPLDRNISYFFDTFLESSFPDTFLCEREELCNYSIQDIIMHFNKVKYKIEKYYRNWFDKFFNITNIDPSTINKSGLQLYKLNNNSYILFSVLEKYDFNITKIEKFLTFKMYTSINKTEDKGDIIKENFYAFKKEIIMYNIYKNYLLNNNLIKNIYNDDDIKYFYQKYK